MTPCTFKNCLENAPLNRNLLLGNGFSIALNEIFKYEKLLGEAKFKNENIDKLFVLHKTTNFEEVMGEIINAKKTLEVLEPKNNFEETIYLKEIRETFVQSLTKYHPENLNSITKIEQVNKFINAFDGGDCKIFTLNYDLLFYWLLMDFKKYNFRDGFYKIKNDPPLLIWTDNNPNVFYLHGALHLYIEEEAGETAKIVSNDGKNIISQIKENLAKDIYPLIILEGTSEHKKFGINKYAYLKNCLNSLSKIEGCIFIHGISFNENDEHIFEIIFKNEKLEKIYIGLHPSDEDEVKNRVNKLCVKYSCPKPKIIYYDAEPIFSYKESFLEETQ